MLEAAVWGTYGFVAGDRATLTYGTLHFLTSGVIVMLRLRRAGRGDATPTLTHAENRS